MPIKRTKGEGSNNPDKSISLFSRRSRISNASRIEDFTQRNPFLSASWKGCAMLTIRKSQKVSEKLELLPETYQFHKIGSEMILDLQRQSQCMKSVETVWISVALGYCDNILYKRLENCDEIFNNISNSIFSLPNFIYTRFIVNESQKDFLMLPRGSRHEANEFTFANLNLFTSPTSQSFHFHPPTPIKFHTNTYSWNVSRRVSPISNLFKIHQVLRFTKRG